MNEITSREVMLRTLNFDNPPRIPLDLWVLPWAENKYPQEVAALRKDFPGDISGPPVELSKPSHTEGDPYQIGLSRDAWGCVFENLIEGVIGEVKNPIVQDWDRDVEKIHIPREWLTFDREVVRDFCQHDDHFILAGCCPRPFEQLQFIRGTENLYVDLMEKPEGFMAFLREMHDFYCELVEEWAKMPVDGISFMDDWGAQQTMLISPKTWRELFRPMYQDYIRIAKAHGKKTFMHSDGHITAIYPDLIEIGLDALNSQIFCMGIENLAQFRGKITFWGEIDRQWLLPHGTTTEIRQAVKKVHELLYANGGIIGQCEFGLNAKPENVRAMFETWAEL